MKFFSKGKDGGPKSTVTGYWLFEIKPLASIVLLRFDQGSREAYHNHAFNAISWVLKGELEEVISNYFMYEGREVTTQNHYKPSLWPIWTPRECLHKVYGKAPVTWVLSLRGPWNPTWKEVVEDREITLTNGRKEVN